MRLHAFVLTSAVSSPTAVAIVDADGPMTYGELSARADGVAHRLLAAGVRAGDRVAVLASKSAATVAAMQGVLRIGAAYVPIETPAPVDRVRKILQDCRPVLVLVDGDTGGDILADYLATRADLPTLPVADAADPAGHDVVDAQTNPDDLAYILYTSGSTGVPKGVSITHTNATAFVEFFVAEFELGASDRLANHASFGFDLSVFDLYGSFAAGAAVHLVPKILGYSPRDLVDWIEQEGITVWYSVPSALMRMMDEGQWLERPAPPALREILFAGEPFPIEYVRRLARWSPAGLNNLYGPTETNVCTFHRVRMVDLDRTRPVPIGTPCCGDTVRLVGDDGRPVTEPGVAGRLLVSGPTVTPGYWGKPPQTGAYDTGDYATLLADGALDYVGRRDGMVKVNGYRVELGEVETALEQCPGVGRACVVVDERGAGQQLVGYVVPSGSPAVDLPAVRGELARRLPPYMIVNVLHSLPDFPLSANGKIDRRALAERTVGDSTLPPTPAVAPALVGRGVSS